MRDELKNLSIARLSHANDCLKEAKVLLAADEYRGVANRSYYAAFHALRAVLVYDEFDSKKHSGIIAKFRELYLKTGLFDKEFSDAISSLFRVRSSSDYDDFYIVSKQEATEQLKKSEMIIELISKYLENTFNV